MFCLGRVVGDNRMAKRDVLLGNFVRHTHARSRRSFRLDCLTTNRDDGALRQNAHTRLWRDQFIMTRASARSLVQQY